MKLLALDMDGTCLNSYSKISKKTMDALYHSFAVTYVRLQLEILLYGGLQAFFIF